MSTAVNRKNVLTELLVKPTKGGNYRQMTSDELAKRAGYKAPNSARAIVSQLRDEGFSIKTKKLKSGRSVYFYDPKANLAI